MGSKHCIDLEYPYISAYLKADTEIALWLAG